MFVTNLDRILQALHTELQFDFVRSSGPGGQNVNKVATAAQLRFDLAKAATLSEDEKRRLAKLAGKRVSADGILTIEAKRHRTQDQNREDAIERFDNLVRHALAPRTTRVPTRATAASREKRLESKRRKGLIKKVRQGRTYEY
jgi:ribosome-associated protein